MIKKKKIEGKIVPAFERHLDQPSVGDITRVPSVTAIVKSGLASVSCVGLIDTGADISVIDKTVFKKLGKQIPKPSRKLLATGFSSKRVSFYELELILRGVTRKQELIFSKVPVQVSQLHRRVMIIGRRGVLELLRIEIDFPRGTISLVRSQRLTDNYPSLSTELPGFQRAAALIEEDAVMQGIIILVIELEKLLDKIILDKFERTTKYKKQLVRASLREKFLALKLDMDLLNLLADLETIITSRNLAIHTDPTARGELSPNAFLAAAERIVFHLSRIQRSNGLEKPNSSRE